MTTHSHVAGFLHETVLSFDCVLPDGMLILDVGPHHSDERFRKLYAVAAWSHGTVCTITRMRLRCIPAKPYVRLTYLPIVNGVDGKSYHEEFRQLAHSSHSFVEAQVFSRDRAVLMWGDFSDATDPSIPINRVHAWWKPWWFKHVEAVLRRHEESSPSPSPSGRHGSSDGAVVEYVPIDHYLLRHTRGIFWVIRDMLGDNLAYILGEPTFTVFGMHVPNPLLLLGWLYPPRISFLKFTTTPTIRLWTFTRQTFQDIVLPIEETEAAVRRSEKLFDVFPILLYPCRVYESEYGLVNIDSAAASARKLQGKTAFKECLDEKSGRRYRMFFDLGVYGVPRLVREKRFEEYDPVREMRSMEEFIAEAGGMPFLYADTCMTRAEFAKVFRLTTYDEVRTQLFPAMARAFPHLYDKTKSELDLIRGALGEIEGEASPPGPLGSPADKKYS